MAENDETKQHTGADVPAGESAPETTAIPVEPAGESVIAQRSSLPMRRASTMPDLSRFDDKEPARGAGATGPAAAATAEQSDPEPASDSVGDSPAPRSSVSDQPESSSSATSGTVDDPAPDTAALSARPSEEEAKRRAAERDEAFTSKPVMARVFQVLIAGFFPIMLLAAAIRAVTSPLFLWVEYHRPGFPADSFGFSTDDRMTYGSYTVDYILNWASPRYLGELVNSDGDQLFLDSEVGHMLDVKVVLVISFAVALAMFVFTIAACWYLARTYPGGVRRGLFAGALTTLILMIALTVTAILGWQTFFTQVHALFFADGTWTFRADDTLIRLFPAQFWMDAAITVAALVLIVTVVTLVLTWPTKGRRDRSRLAGEAAQQRRLDSLAL
ncbi:MULTISPECIES: TIGR01906 family membrane protein [unclassified Arthrobacter]|uniref:TIGR01906 family membrane protein n=1 Tax=unclassified Arthrobacter TaxID=235627 RepID=UPI00042261EC|nr:MULTISPECIES: TIGR01906 family membrane protein [unclassified Arthrobacter]PVE16455.1 TIGR01906 family membrane protein [Arthrobacter sp. Bz4]